MTWASGAWASGAWAVGAWAEAGGGDVTTPTILSVAADTNGTDVSITLSENCTIGAGGSTGFVLVATGGNSALTYSIGDGTDVLIYASARTISSTETLSLTYVNPGDGIEDAAGNDLESVTGQTVTNNSTVNNTPSDLLLSNTTVYTTGGLNATVGTLSAVDADAGETFTYTLVAGTGDTDNASFNIDGARLRCNDPNALGVSTRSVRIRVTDSAANTREEAFSISVAVGGFAITSAVTSSCTSSVSGSI